jgi:hypothetical protein
MRTATAHGIPDRHPADELGLVLRDAVVDGVINRGAASLIARSRIAGDRVADVAQYLGVRPGLCGIAASAPSELSLATRRRLHRAAVSCAPVLVRR